MSVQSALDIINTELALRYPEREGLQDFLRLNISPETAAKAHEQLIIVSRRVTLLEAAKEALEALMADPFYPEIPDLGVNEAVFAELTDQRNTIQAALDTFTEITEAASMTFTIGTPRPKQSE